MPVSNCTYIGMFESTDNRCSMMVLSLVIVFIPQNGIWVNWLFWIYAAIEKVYVCMCVSRCFVVINRTSLWRRV